MIYFIQTVMNGVSIGAIYGLIAVGFIVIYKCSGVFNMAQGELVLIGAYLAWTGTVLIGLPIWLAILLGMGVSAGMGVLTERLAVRPLVGVSAFTLVMMTIALAMVFRGSTLLIWTAWPRAFPSPFPKMSFELGAFSFNYTLFWGLIICLIAMGGFFLFFKYHRSGLSMRVVAEDVQLAQSQGINVNRIIAMTWVISCTLATVSGVVIATKGTVSQGVAEIGMKALPAVLVAGLESIHGAVLAGIIIGVFENIGAAYLDPLTGGGMGDAFPFIIMILVLLIRPYGLFGYKRIERL